MEQPQNEIADVIVRLCTADRAAQEETLETYFTSNASFKHPFCAVTNDRTQIIRIYQWYKILSPNIEVTVGSVAHDSDNEILFANVSQKFKIWFIPYYVANVKLTTVLHLVTAQSHAAAKLTLPESNKYYIKSQEDLYQTDEFVKFFLPWSIGTTIVGIWHYFATLVCVYGAKYHILIASILSGLLGLVKVMFGRVKGFLGWRSEQNLVETEPSQAPTSSRATDETRRDSGKEVTDGQSSANGIHTEVSTARKKPHSRASDKVSEMERKSNLGHKALR